MVTRNAGWIVAVGSIAGLSRHPREASHRRKSVHDYCAQ